LFAGIVAATLANYFGSAGYAFRRDYFTAAFAWRAAAFMVLLKLFYGAYIDLVPEEAYYWDYAKHLALSYFDHPPLASWTIWLSTSVLGDTEFAVRLVGAGYGLLGCLGAYLLAKDWYGEKAAAAAVLAYPLLPMGFAYSFLATPDAPLVPMCLLAVWAAGRAVKTGDNRWFLLVGLFGGLGGLAKYSIAVVPVGLLVYALWERKLASWLLSGWVWLGVLISIIVVSPVLIWNHQHDWASFGFQFAKRLVAPETGRNRSLYNLGGFLGYQFGAVSPLLPFMGVWGIVQAFREGRKEHRLFLSVGLAFVLGFMLYSLRGETKPNWTLPGLLVLSPMVFHLLYQSEGRLASVGRQAVKWSLIVLAFVYAAGMYHLVFLLPGTPPVRKMDGWRELGAEVKEMSARIEEETGRKPLVIGGDRYHVAVEAAFYGDAVYNTVGYWGVGGPYALNFRYWLDLEDFRGADVIYLDRERDAKGAIERVGPYVEGTRAVMDFRAMVQGREAQRFVIMHLSGYKPPEKNPWEQ
jgi:dolichol-phosphate mannosyltransferase